ncbi:MAG: hypothetical protein SV062_10045, partial [Thermodesulfobacteriota bacterium]|nr:hypothetical protein [Thermodesulfobacteriota bacterium]
TDLHKAMVGKSDDEIEKIKLHQKFNDDAIREFLKRKGCQLIKFYYRDFSRYRWMVYAAGNNSTYCRHIPGKSYS